MPTKTLPKRSPSTKIDAAVALLRPGAGPHCASISLQPALAPHDGRRRGCARAHWRRRRSAAALPWMMRSRSASTRGGHARPCSPRASSRVSVLCSDSNTDEEGGGAGVAGVGREVEEHDGRPCARRARLRRSVDQLAPRARPARRRARCRVHVVRRAGGREGAARARSRCRRRRPRRRGRRRPSGRWRRRVRGWRPSWSLPPAAGRARSRPTAPASGTPPDARRGRARRARPASSSAALASL